MAPLNYERLTALRQALMHAEAATATLIDLSAALKEAGAPGLAWDAGYLCNGTEALAGAVALLLKAEEEQTGTSDQDEAARARLRAR